MLWIKTEMTKGIDGLKSRVLRFYVFGIMRCWAI